MLLWWYAATRDELRGLEVLTVVGEVRARQHDTADVDSRCEAPGLPPGAMEVENPDGGGGDDLGLAGLNPRIGHNIGFETPTSA